MAAVLQVALGVFSLYALLALIVTVLQELLARALQHPLQKSSNATDRVEARAS